MSTESCPFCQEKKIKSQVVCTKCIKKYKLLIDLSDSDADTKLNDLLSCEYTEPILNEIEKSILFWRFESNE